jgi:hypothetical protein
MKHSPSTAREIVAFDRFGVTSFVVYSQKKTEFIGDTFHPLQ